MKKLFTLLGLIIFTLGLQAQSGVSTFKYEIRVPSIRVGGATKLKLDSIIQSTDTIKFFSAGSELFSKGAGTWTGTGIGLDTTWARLSLRIDQVTNESKAAMFNAPIFTSFVTIQDGIVPSVSGNGYLGTTTLPWGNIYMRPASSINWDNGGLILFESSDKLMLSGGNLSIGSNSMELTGSIGGSASRSTKGWFTDLDVTNPITGTISSVTGYTPAGGSLTLNGADALTIRTTAATDVTLPTSGTLLTTVSLAGYAPLSAPAFTDDLTVQYIRPVTSTGVALGNPSYPWANLYMSSTGGVIWDASTDIILAPAAGELRLENSPLLINNNDIGKTTQPVRHGYFNEITIVDTVHIANIANVPTISTTDTLSTQAYAREQIADSLANLIATASIGLSAADTNTYGGAVTRTYVESLLGGGSGLSAQRLPFIIDVTTGAPSASDSTVTHTEFAGKHIDVYRDGAKQYQQFTTTNIYEGFRVSDSTITVNPVWQANEQVLIDIIEPIMWSYLSLSGQESSLLDDLNAYWKFDENSGVVLADAMGVQNATIYHDGLTADSKIGRAVQVNDSTEYIIVAYNTNVSPKGATFSISMWVKLDTLPSVAGRNYFLFQQNNPSAPYGPHNAKINLSDNKIEFNTTNTSGTEYTAYSSGALSVATWYHIVLVNRGNGSTLQVYVNGADVSSAAETFTGTVYEGISSLNIGNAFSSSSWWFSGVFDEIGIWSVALSAGNVTTLYNSGNGRTHPFN